jgi:hypothetical protein
VGGVFQRALNVSHKNTDWYTAASKVVGIGGSLEQVKEELAAEEEDQYIHTGVAVTFRNLNPDVVTPFGMTKETKSIA